MLWQSRGNRENAFAGQSAYGWFRPLAPRRLGQALRCWPTEDGGAVCSNLMYYSPECPETPPLTESQVLPTPPEAAAAT